MHTKRIPVSARAVTQRINRALAKDGKRLSATRGQQAKVEFGDYYIISGKRDRVFVHDYGFDLKEFATKLGVLQSWEALESEK